MSCTSRLFAELCCQFSTIALILPNVTLLDFTSRGMTLRPMLCTHCAESDGQNIYYMKMNIVR